MCFRLKVVDALPYLKADAPVPHPFDRQCVISFVKSQQSLYDSFEEGYRYRFFNVKPECFYREGTRIKP